MFVLEILNGRLVILGSEMQVFDLRCELCEWNYSKMNLIIANHFTLLDYTVQSEYTMYNCIKQVKSVI